MSDASEKPFTLSVPDAELELLKKKLELATLPTELDEAAWDYGVPLADVKRLVDHWKNGFNWRKYEAEINKIPQFTRDIEAEGFGSLNVHYAHVRSEDEKAIPLLFVHGWPGHFMEAAKLIPLLTAVKPGEPSFHVVAPSLPAFGFSEAPKKKGFSVCNNLMIALGYKSYGGDWGYFIGRKMANVYGHKHVKAWHTNMPVAGFPSITSPFRFVSALLTMFLPPNLENLKGAQRFLEDGNAYFRIQASRTQTLAYSLRDSPIGLLAWVYEKLVAWTDSYPWTDDEVLAWVSIYWFSRGGPDASTRLYYEATHAKSGDETREQPYSSIPLGLSFFPKEIVTLPR
ncbi:hypothetical protein EIP91_010852, partial [Steccherinum ochraceum]